MALKRVEDYGAQADGRNDDTAAFQRAIKEAMEIHCEQDTGPEGLGS